MFLAVYLSLISGIVLSGATSLAGVPASGGIALGFIVGLMVVGRRAKLSPAGSLNPSFTLLARGGFSIIIADLALAGGLAAIPQPFAALYVLVLAGAAPLLAKESDRIYGLPGKLLNRPGVSEAADEEAAQGQA